ncbi:MAG: hypothetical protein H6855_00980 [Rhodospirillales bacterium]|nr:hypothetical protein [Rhodospirillales bacterium]MCB9964642.1 hypothetical protein [Rhodospirillales bacterium]MCB9979932.1 hypothetical protein [Rhodospirillales bacterium]
MKDNVISVLNTNVPSGLSNFQFRRLDQLYCLAVSRNVLSHRTVDCDFDAGMLRISLSKSAHHESYLEFIAEKVGPRTTMYALYLNGKGLIARSALFERVLERMQEEVWDLIGPV